MLSQPLLESSIRPVLPFQSICFIMGRSGSNLEELRNACNVTVRIAIAQIMGFQNIIKYHLS